MKYKSKKLDKLISHLPILLVVSSIYIKGVQGIDKAESRRFVTKGNQLLNGGHLADALTQYHGAIENDNTNYQAYFMRATVYLAMSKARAALPDLNEVMRLQPTFAKARLQRGNLLLKMGRFNEAQTDYEAVLSREENAEATKKVEEIRPLRRSVNHAAALMQQKQFPHALQLLNQVIEACPWNADFRELRATAHEHVGDLRKAVNDLRPTTILRLDNTKAFLKISVLQYKLGEMDQSLVDIRECLKLDPDEKECKKHYKHVRKIVKTFEKGKQFMAENEFHEAIERYRTVLEREPNVIPLTVECKLKICECFIKAGDFGEVINEASDVIDVENGNIPAHIVRSDAYTQMEMYEEAVEDLQKALQLDESYPGLRDKLKQAQKMLKQSKKKDYYKILGVPRNARKQDIVKAYRKKARTHHPDNFKNEKEKKENEKIFIDIASAKEVLTDPEMRKKFDAGIDPLDPESQNQGQGRGGGFNPFGQGGGGFKFHFGGGGGGFHDFHDEF